MFVKAEGFRILLVYIDRQAGMRGEDIAYEGFSNAFAVMIGGDEKRFQMPVMQEHETERRIGTIDGKKQGHLGEEFQKLGLDCIAVAWVKEVVGSVNGCTPDVHDARQIGRGGRAEI
jgi:hypothetical protein